MHSEQGATPDLLCCISLPSRPQSSRALLPRRTPRRNQRRTAAILFALASAAMGTLIEGCASGSKGQTPSTSSAIAVSCTPSTLTPGQTAQCSAVLSGSSTASFTWSASAGTITSSGVFTAPSTTSSVNITASNAQNAKQSGQTSLTIQLKTPASKHVVMVMEENQSFETVVGNTGGWPNLNKLMGQGAMAENYYADVHPSIGNYFMLTTGELVTTDDSSTTVWNVDSIARRMLADGVSFRIYAEGITQGYVGGDTGRYVLRHNPFALLSDIADNAQVAGATIWPFSQFTADVASNNLPEFSFIVPNLDDDAHDGTQLQADTWLQSNVVAPLATLPAFKTGGDGVLIVEFDEAIDLDITHGGGHVSPVFWGPNVRPGFTQVSSTVFQHESMLRTVMEALNLQNPPGNAATAPDMAEFFLQK